MTRAAASGIRQFVKTGWFVEGLLHLESSSVTSILGRLDLLSVPGSVALYDVVGASLLASPVLAATLQMMREFGAPWTFGSDAPASLLPGWRATVTDPAIFGNVRKRWPFPADPPGVPGVPRGYFIEAIKGRGGGLQIQTLR